MTRSARHLMSVPRPVQTAPTPLVDQLVTAGVPLANIYAYGPRKLYSGASNAYNIRRSSDSTLQDVGFNSIGDLNIASMAAFVGSSIGTVKIPYDQTGNGANFGTAASARELQIMNGGDVFAAGPKSRPTLYVPGTDYGYVASMPSTLSVPQASAFLIASMSNTVTAAAPRFVSMLDASTNGDSSAAGRGVLIYRNSTASPTPTWASNRNGVVKGSVTGTFSQLDQVASICDGTNATMWLANATSNGSGSTGNYSATRIGMGLTGSTYSMLPGALICELIFIRTTIVTSTIRNIIHADQATYYGVA